ncbi:hypothetical protein ASC68_25080 [Devosia sp. Root105]|nr:hypothetical protein ASC68_25080 [Devosia sp. Root105]
MARCDSIDQPHPAVVKSKLRCEIVVAWVGFCFAEEGIGLPVPAELSMETASDLVLERRATGRLAVGCSLSRD